MVYRRIIIASILLLAIRPCWGQLDSVFWFVAPEISQHNSPNTFDRPIKLNIASVNSSPITITVSQPANPAFSSITENIPANGIISIDLTSQINIIENKPEFAVLPYGLLIQATGIVSVYYEISLGGVNPECYSLKGKNALGTDFMIPGQSEYRNGTQYNPSPYNRIDFVATTDNTIVTINPSQNIPGHAANNPFYVTLNKGETYCIRANGADASSHLHGTTVTSNHPIAITVSDDLLNATGTSGYDLIGDQLVPINLIGEEYIAIRGQLSHNNDRVYILATEDNTAIYTNGSTTPISTINRRETYPLSYPSGENVVYIKTSKPAYAFQLTGIGGELGAAVLPHIICTGSKEVRYQRSTGTILRINILVKNGGEGSFLVNGASNIITSSDFVSVPGSNNEWKYTSKEIPTSTIPHNTLITITNDHEFQMGVFEGGPTGGLSYAFFSDYAQNFLLSPTSNHADNDHLFCVGDTAILFLENENDFTNIRWTKPNGEQVSANSLIINNISLSDLGEYSVIADGSCAFEQGTIAISIFDYPLLTLEDSISTCEETIILDAGNSAMDYLWSTEEESSTIEVNHNATFYVTACNSICCSTDSVHIHFHQAPLFTLSKKGDLCVEKIVELSIITDNSFVWSTGENEATIYTETIGLFSVTVSNDICDASESIYVGIENIPKIDIITEGDLCEGQVLLSVQTTAENIIWGNGASEESIFIQTSGLYEVSVNTGLCYNSDFISVPSCPCDIWVPNAFSPNGDGVNDYFEVFCRNPLTHYHLAIYNRVSHLIFTTDDIHHQWDGKYKGKYVPIDVYIYIIEYQCEEEDARKKYKNGSVVIYR